MVGGESAPQIYIEPFGRPSATSQAGTRIFVSLLSLGT